MTAVAKTRLAYLESRIRKGLNSFLEVGQALLEIQKDELYQKTHNTFEDYCRERWHLSSSRSYQLIAASITVERIRGYVSPLSTIVDAALPANEAQVRPLTRLPEAERADAWQEAVRISDGPVIAKHVTQVVERRLPIPKPTGHHRPVPVAWNGREEWETGESPTVADDWGYEEYQPDLQKLAFPEGGPVAQQVEHLANAGGAFVRTEPGPSASTNDDGGPVGTGNNGGSALPRRYPQVVGHYSGKVSGEPSTGPSEFKSHTSSIPNLIEQAWDGAAAFAEMTRLRVDPRDFLAAKPSWYTVDPLPDAASYVKRVMAEAVFA